MKTLLTIIFICVFPGISFSVEDLSHITDAGGTVYFADDMEGGLLYRGPTNTYEGKGWWDRLGGNPTGSIASNPCSFDTNVQHATHISDDIAAQGAIVGSTHAMKTPYDGDCPTERFPADTSIIATGTPLTEYYIRWYQKFSGNWMNGSAQHKLFKQQNVMGGVGGLRFGTNENIWRTLAPNNHLPGGGVRWPESEQSFVWVYEANIPDWNRVNDDLDNGIDEGSDGAFPFQTDTWYCIEMHWKAHTAGNADGVYEAWVDGVKVFRIGGMVWGDADDYTIAGTGTTAIELQHIYYDRATSDDQPTYMDNIVIADRYIGPANNVGKKSGKPIQIGVGQPVSFSGGVIVKFE